MELLDFLTTPFFRYEYLYLTQIKCGLDNYKAGNLVIAPRKNEEINKNLIPAGWAKFYQSDFKKISAEFGEDIALKVLKQLFWGISKKHEFPRKYMYPTVDGKNYYNFCVWQHFSKPSIRFFGDKEEFLRECGYDLVRNRVNSPIPILRFLANDLINPDGSIIEPDIEPDKDIPYGVKLVTLTEKKQKEHHISISREAAVKVINEVIEGEEKICLEKCFLDNLTETTTSDCWLFGIDYSCLEPDYIFYIVSPEPTEYQGNYATGGFSKFSNKPSRSRWLYGREAVELFPQFADQIEELCLNLIVSP